MLVSGCKGEKQVLVTSTKWGFPSSVLAAPELKLRNSGYTLQKKVISLFLCILPLKSLTRKIHLIGWRGGLGTLIDKPTKAVAGGGGVVGIL